MTEEQSKPVYSYVLFSRTDGQFVLTKMELVKAGWIETGKRKIGAREKLLKFLPSNAKLKWRSPPTESHQVETYEL